MTKPKYPYLSLQEVNTEVHMQLYSVLETFEDKHLSFTVDGYERSIAQVIAHTLTTPKEYFIEHLVLDKDISDYSEPEIESIQQALKLTEKAMNDIECIIKDIDRKELQKIIKTEWGQEMRKELAIWQALNHVVLHTGELTLMAGQGGFYQSTLG
jgi:uncharacterized damage-inducible protein DinB